MNFNVFMVLLQTIIIIPKAREKKRLHNLIKILSEVRNKQHQGSFLPSLCIYLFVYFLFFVAFFFIGFIFSLSCSFAPHSSNLLRVKMKTDEASLARQSQQLLWKLCLLKYNYEHLTHTDTHAQIFFKVRKIIAGMRQVSSGSPALPSLIFLFQETSPGNDLY